MGCIKPLRTYYDQAIEHWSRANSGRILAEYQVSEVFAEAHGKVVTVSAAVNAFRKSGLRPSNLDVFEDLEFAPSATTDIALWNADLIKDDSEQPHVSTIPETNESPETENRMSDFEQVSSSQLGNTVGASCNEEQSAVVQQSLTNATF